MEGRRVRRFGRVQRDSRNLLPLHVRRLSNTVSCWYCDFKTSVFNQPLFRVGRNYSRCLRVWFSVGIGFSLTAMLGVCMILFLELASLLRLYNENAWLGRLLSGPLFGIPSSGLGLGMSLADVGYMCMSTIISVSVHEFGHAFAAARLSTTFMESSEGIQIEYVAVFLAVLFPGALVAFNYELLQALPTIATLRIYCAGIWHNAACCALCGLSLFFLPLILYPFYIHGESPMVLEVPSTSPLYGFLSPGDLITSLDGIRVHDARELMELATHLHGQIHQESKNFNDSSMRVNVEHGYCVPNTLMEASKELQLPQDQHTCPSDFSAFATITCSNSSYDDITEYNHQKSAESIHCLIPKDVVKLKKCGDGWAKSSSNKSSCLCSEDETCVNPIQTPDSMWVEITYSSPYTIGCWKTENNSSSASKSPNSEEMSCAGAFVFIGDVVSMAHSIRLTSYRPHWSFYFGVNLPSALEKLLVCTFHVSLTLALLNSLPVYFLDGESILEATLCYLKLLSPRMQGRVLQLCFFGGTVISILAFLRILFSTILYT